LGYIIWYAALQDLNAKHAALIQLAVPLLAATGGVLFLSEPLVFRLIVAAFLILGGITLAIVLSDRIRRPPSEPLKPEINLISRVSSKKGSDAAMRYNESDLPWSSQ
jgi:hypothetical protein